MLLSNISYIDITQNYSLPMLGYGDRSEWSKGIYDNIYAYLWTLKNETGSYNWIILDLCFLNISTISLLKNKLCLESEIDYEKTFISTTHTHSAPDLNKLYKEKNIRIDFNLYLEEFETRLINLLNNSKNHLEKSEIFISTQKCSIGTNRRLYCEILDDEVFIFKIFSNKKVNGIVVYYSCHPTVLGSENLKISADWVGIVRTKLQEIYNVPVMFIQGAHGDIDPISRGKLHLNDPKQSIGASHKELVKISDSFVNSFKKNFKTLKFTKTKRFVVEEKICQIPTKFGKIDSQKYLSLKNKWENKFKNFLKLEKINFDEPEILNEKVKKQCMYKNLDDDQIIHWIAEQYKYFSFVNTFKQVAIPNDGYVNLKITYFDFEKIVLACAPVEFLSAVGIEQKNLNNHRKILVVSLFGGYFGYFPHYKNYFERDKDLGYETISSIFDEKSSKIFKRFNQTYLDHGP